MSISMTMKRAMGKILCVRTCLCLAIFLPFIAARSYKPKHLRNRGAIRGLLSHNEERFLQNSTSCDLESYSTSLLITHLGNYSNIPVSEFPVIEDAILQAYNNLETVDACNPEYRNITLISLDISSIDQIKETNSPTGEFQARYKISGRCNTCQEDAGGPLFGQNIATEVGKRKLTIKGSVFERPRRLKVGMTRKGGISGDPGKGSMAIKSVMSGKSTVKGTMTGNAKTAMNAKSMPTSSKKPARPSKKSSSGNERTGITPLDLQEAINEELSSVRSQLSGDYNVTDLAEAKELACSSNLVSYESLLLLQLDVDYESITSADKKAFEIAFFNAYNGLNFERCDDPYFRTISLVTADRIPQRRMLVEAFPPLSRFLQKKNGFNASRVIRLSTETQCRDCPEGTPLFTNNEDASRRALLSTTKDLLRSLQSLKNECFCSAASVNTSTAPSVGLFESVVNDRLRVSQADGSEDNSHSVERLVEVKEVECSANPDSLKSTIILSLEGGIGSLNDQDQRVLEASVLTSYNELLFSACDVPLFRKATAVMIDETDSWLGQQPFPTHLNKKDLIKLSTAFECRDCASSNTSMFAVADKDYNVSFIESSNGFDQQIQSSSCFCPLQSFNHSISVTTDLFRERYNAFARERLENVGNVAEVMEVESFNCSSNASEVYSLLLVEFEDDPNLLINSDLLSFEKAVRSAYNDLNFYTCDNPFFRTALEFVLLESQPLSDYNSSTSVNTTNVAKISARFACRDCLSSLSLLSWSNENLIYDESRLDMINIAADPLEGLGNSCYCPLNNMRKYRSPTAAEIVVAVNGALQSSPQERQSSGSLLPRLMDAVEIDEVACSQQKYAFQTEVYIRLNQNTTSLSDEELAALRNSFIDTYNSLTFAFCDTQNFRRVLDVQINVPSGRRRLTLERREQQVDALNAYSNFNKADDPYLLQFLVNVECRECTTETRMFSDSGSFDTVAELPSSFSPLLTFLADAEDQGGANGTCFCSSSFPSQFRAPTAAEFKQTFNTTVAGLEEIGVLRPSEVIEDVIEIKQVGCSENVSQFTATVYVGLRGNLALLTQDEKSALEQAFQDSYNAISFSRCDSYFRNVLNVSLTPLSDQTKSYSRLLQTVSNSSGFNTSATSNTTSVSAPSDSAVFQVVGQCRGCPISSTGTFSLFDDAFRSVPANFTRHLFNIASQLRPFLRYRRLLQGQADGCLCPINAEPTQPDAPTEDEFLTGYGAAVTELRKSGKIMNVVGVSDIKSCNSDVKEISGLYTLSFSGDEAGFSDKQKNDFIAKSFNSLRTEVCSTQVVNVIKVDSSLATGDYIAEVVAISAGSAKESLFAIDKIDKAAFLKKLNALIGNTGVDASADTVTFQSPLVRCTTNRNTYSVSLQITFSSGQSLSCPQTQPPSPPNEGNNGNNAGSMPPQSGFNTNLPPPPAPPNSGGGNNQPSFHNGQQLQSSPPNGHQPQLPPSNNHQPQLPPSSSQQPQLPPPNGQQPQLPPSNNQQPQLPPSNNQQPQLPPSNNQQPQLPPSSSQQPQLPPSSSQQPQLPPPNGQQPQLPPSSSQQPLGQQPQLPPSNNQQPQLSPSSSQQPQLPPPNGQQPHLPPSNNQQPQLPPSSSQQPPVLPPNGQQPQLPPSNNQQPQLPPSTSQQPQLPPPNGQQRQLPLSTSQQSQLPPSSNQQPRPSPGPGGTQTLPTSPPPPMGPAPGLAPTSPQKPGPSGPYPQNQPGPIPSSSPPPTVRPSPQNPPGPAPGPMPSLPPNRMPQQMNGSQDCTERTVSSEVEGIFETTYASLSQALCDPFKRRVNSISCQPNGAGVLCCRVDFGCSGPCGEWLQEDAIYQQQDAFQTSVSCDACHINGASKRAPLSSEHQEAINNALENQGITIESVRTGGSSCRG